MASVGEVRVTRSGSKMKNVEDIYRLTGTQAGMMYHSLMGAGTGVYVEQFSYRVGGDLDKGAFRRAWEKVVERHGMLRASLVWEKTEWPMQVIWKQVKLRWEERRWSGEGEEERKQQVTEYLREDRRAGFDLKQAPLMRMMLVGDEEKGYEFIWSFHHVLLDGWSVPVVLREVVSYYEGYREGREVEMERPVSFGEYLRWLRRQDEKEGEQYWRRRLAGYRGGVGIGGGERRGAGEGEQGQVQVRLTREVTAGLQQMGRRYQVTLNTVLGSSWGVLLSRYSGEKDVVFGVTVGGRPAGVWGVERMVGPLINTLPVRMQVEEEEVWSQWLQSQQREQARMREYEYLSLAQIQQWSQVPPGSPLFETLFVFENYPNMGLEEMKGKVPIEGWHVLEKTNYPITALVKPGVEPELVLRFDRSRYDTSLAMQLVAHWVRLLESAVENPERKLWELSMLSEQEQRWLLEENNQTAEWYPGEKCLHQLFEEQAERTPESMAVVQQEQRMSYRELNERGNQLGQVLREKGVGPEVLVGICMERTPEMVVALLGILKAGGAYVPMNAEHPAGWNRQVLEESQVRLVITEQSSQGQVEAVVRECRGSEPVEVLNLSKMDWSSARGCNLRNITSPEHLIYLIYTSGSTGRPKGVMVQQQGAVNHLWAKITSLNIVCTDVVAQTAALSFDISVWQIWAALLVGGRVELIATHKTRSAEELAAALEEGGVTIAELVPSMIQAIVQVPVKELPKLGRLRWLLTTGEIAPEVMGMRWVEMFGHTKLLNAYGPTECSDDVSQGEFVKGEQGRESGTVPIGRPIANIRLYVLDKEYKAVPVGVVGELYIGGVGVGRGYRGRAGETGEKFVPDPYSREGGGRLYRTGDLVRWRRDGNLEFLGRKDQQVKIRGYRIEMGEIEGVMREREGVREAVVEAREWGGRKEKRLVGYVVMEAGRRMDGGEMQQWLRRRLPEYMVPATFLQLEKLPLTANGKLDRRNLTDPGPATTSMHYEAPHTETEKELATIWSRLLRVERVGLHDNLFDLGGDSLLLTRLQSEIKKNLKQEIPITEMFSRPTVSELAGVLDRTITTQTSNDGDSNIVRQLRRAKSEHGQRMQVQE